MNIDRENGKIFSRLFENRKLSREEFQDKYWLKGESIYQFHTPDIEDGRDEREQFIFNDIRALDNLIDFYFNLESEARQEISEKLHRLEPLIKISAALAATSAAAWMIWMISQIKIRK